MGAGPPSLWGPRARECSAADSSAWWGAAGAKILKRILEFSLLAVSSFPICGLGEPARHARRCHPGSAPHGLKQGLLFLANVSIFETWPGRGRHSQRPRQLSCCATDSHRRGMPATARLCPAAAAQHTHCGLQVDGPVSVAQQQHWACRRLQLQCSKSTPCIFYCNRV